MSSPRIRKPAALGLGLAAMLAASLAGCGDTTADKDNAVVVPDPNAVVTTKTPSAKAGTPTESPGVAAKLLGRVGGDGNRQGRGVGHAHG